MNPGTVVASRLSVALITRNEAHNLTDCLHSVAWADEVVVVDNGSTDATVALAQSLGARVIVAADWPGFGLQKNRALDACTGDWILSLDADERVTPELQAEIVATLRAPAFDVYEMPRRSSFCGRFIKHSGWTPDYCRRLLRRGAARFSHASVHETLVVDRPVGRLRTPLIHFSYRDLASVLEKMNRYSSGSARDVAARGGRGSLALAIGHGLWAFFRTYVLRLGVLDGAEGFMIAVVNAETSYYKYLKVAELHRQRQETKSL